MAALVSLMAISITKKAMNKDNNNTIFIYLLSLSVIGLSLFSLSVSMIITTNAQSSSDSTTYGGSSSGNRSDATQMGICIIGGGGPCNGDSNFDGRHDMTRQCILSNGC
jgi:hypothetical protein